MFLSCFLQIYHFYGLFTAYFLREENVCKSCIKINLLIDINFKNCRLNLHKRMWFLASLILKLSLMFQCLFGLVNNFIGDCYESWKCLDWNFVYLYFVGIRALMLLHLIFSCIFFHENFSHKLVFSSENAYRFQLIRSLCVCNINPCRGHV